VGFPCVYEARGGTLVCALIGVEIVDPERRLVSVRAVVWGVHVVDGLHAGEASGRFRRRVEPREAAAVVADRRLGNALTPDDLLVADPLYVDLHARADCILTAELPREQHQSDTHALHNVVDDVS
jgi:hypothetical protein